MDRGGVQRSRRLDDREAFLLGAIAFFVVIVGARAFLESRHPPAEADLRAGPPVPESRLRIERVSGAHRAHLYAYARSVRFSAFVPAEQGSSTTRPQLELSMPVEAGTCRRMEAAIGPACSVPARVQASLLTLDWKRVETLDMTMLRPGSIALESEGTALGSRLQTWTIESRAGLVHIDFPCVRPTGFALVTPGVPIRGRCSPDGKRMRMRIEAPPDEVPALYLDAVEALSLTARGKRVGAEVEGGSISAGGKQHDLPQRGETVSLESDSANVAVDLGVGEGFRRQYLQATAPQATAVLADSREQLSSQYSELEDGWLVFLGSAIGLLVSAFGGLLRHWSPEA
jgi:hypothetical protein